jgi:hypothetical protein
LSKKDHYQFDVKFIANIISTLVMNKFSMAVPSIQDEIKLHYKYKVSYDKAWVAKQKIIEHFFSSHKESFEILPKLLSTIKESNSRTFVD